MKQTKIILFFTFILGAIAFITSCGSGLRAVELMYAGKNTTQYFISPFTMKGSAGEVEIDMTYRHFADIDTTKIVSCKFTFYSNKSGIEKVSHAYFTTDTDTNKIFLTQLDRFFVERDNNKARYEGKILYSDLKKIFVANSCLFSIVIPNTKLIYGPDGSITKTRIAVRREMIELIED
ncbi:MAG: hypothetical protein JST20_04065 [Bacteroidetes bacterium]|nr:hypothetical protein [Bacteroidota bacterium]